MELTVNQIKEKAEIIDRFDTQILKSDFEYLDLILEKGDHHHFIVSEDSIEKLKNLHKNYTNLELKDLKRKATCIKKYGQPFKNNVEKAKETTKKLYGSENFRNVEKARETCRKRYGVDSTNSLESKKKKIKETVLKNWGVDNVKKSKEIVEKGKKTCLEKWGVENPMQLKDFKKRITLKMREKWEKEKKELENQNNIEMVSFMELKQELQRDLSTLNNFIKRSNLKYWKTNHNCYISRKDADWVKEQYGLRSQTGISQKEKEVVSFLKSIYSGEIIENSKKILGKKELDIFLPGKNLAIEFNGLYWHSDIDMNHNIPTEEEKEFTKYRHLEKTELCEEKGIRLIHIFEDDWDFKREIIEDILKQSLGICDKKVFARKCTLQKINANTYKRFLEENHLQGYSPADLKLGLFYENELVELIGVNTKGTHSKDPELVRLCSKTGVNVIGGFSKLLKHTELSHLVSYIDRATFSGGGYEKTGFTKIKENPPVYFYVKPGKYEKIPRYVFMRKHIEEKFKKGELKYWNPNETEEINMYKNGFGRIWNCGTIKVEWRQSN